jgi:hypothetical protein
VQALKLRPYRGLLMSGIAAILAFFVPTFTVLYSQTVPNGPWQAVLIGNILQVALTTIALVGYARTAVWVSSDEIAERGFFGITRRYHRSELGTTVFANLYHGSTTDTVPQLFVCDPAGRQLIRLRGQFWSQESMQRVLATLDVPATELDHPISTAELHAAYPGLLYWFERQPRLAALIFAAVLALGAAVLYGVLTLLGATAG